MKLIICKRVPIFALNPNIEVVCIDEDTRGNEVFAITQENREKAIEIVELFNQWQDGKDKWKDVAKELYCALEVNMSCINDWGYHEEATSYGIDSKKLYEDAIKDKDEKEHTN